MSRDVLGGFEHRVLLVVAQLQEAYTADVVHELERKTGREAAPAAVYIAMQRLEKRGLLRSQIRRDAGEGDRRPRRYFRATPEALETLGAAQRELTALWQGLELQGEG